MIGWYDEPLLSEELDEVVIRYPSSLDINKILESNFAARDFFWLRIVSGSSPKVPEASAPQLELRIGFIRSFTTPVTFLCSNYYLLVFTTAICVELQETCKAISTSKRP